MKYISRIIWWTGGRELVEYEIQLEDLQVQSVDGISRAVCKVGIRYSSCFQSNLIKFMIECQYIITVSKIWFFLRYYEWKR